jgi:phosphoenolpyruvate synthase/pyruvate phosphate dikinase
LGSNSVTSHTTPRGRSTLRHSNTPRTTGSQDLRIPGPWSHQDLRKDRFPSDISRAGSTRDNQMAGGKHKNISNRNQGYLASSEPNFPTIASPGYTITLKRQDSHLKSLLMMMIEDIKKDTNNSLKEIQENTGKQVEGLKEETQKSLKELQENTTKQMKEMNKTIQDLKMEIETIKKSQRETTLALENLGKRSGVIDVSITNRIQEIEERISGAEDTIENSDTTVKEMQNAKSY